MQIYGTREVATIGPRKHITITYPAPRETLLGVPVALPTSEPLTPQISYTIIADDMPTLTGIAASAVTFTALLYVAGENTTGIAQTYHFSLYKNSIPIVIGVSLADEGQAFWTLNIYKLSGVAVGDVLEVAIWVDDPGLTYLYTALSVQVDTPMVATQGDLLLNLAYTGFVQQPELTLGVPNLSNVAGVRVASGNQMEGVYTSDVAIEAIVMGYTELYLFQYGGNLQSYEIIGNADTYPTYEANLVPTDITFYPTSIRVQ